MEGGEVAKSGRNTEPGGTPERILLPCMAKLELTVLPNAEGRTAEKAEGLPQEAPSPKSQKSATGKSGRKHQ